jgi:hypothetical protein
MKPAIISVHQVGKVGSTSVLKTLGNLLPQEKIHQTHVLHEKSVLASISEWIHRWQRTPNCVMPSNILSSIAVSGQLAHGGVAATDWYLLSLVRDPVARNVSAFFQNLRRAWINHLPPQTRQLCAEILKSKSAAPEPEAVRAVASDLVDLFLRSYRHQFTDRWFDREVKSVFGVDVFAEPFSAERGYHLYQNGSVRLLMFRLEDLARAFEPGVRAWLAGSRWAGVLTATTDLTLQRANEAESKFYAMLYQEFLSQLKFDPALVASEYSTRTARHFYSEAERERFAAKWTKNGTIPEVSPALT